MNQKEVFRYQLLVPLRVSVGEDLNCLLSCQGTRKYLLPWYWEATLDLFSLLQPQNEPSPRRCVFGRLLVAVGFPNWIFSCLFFFYVEITSTSSFLVATGGLGGREVISLDSSTDSGFSPDMAKESSSANEIP